MERIVDVATDGLYLNVLRGFLVVSRSGEEQGRIPLDDIGAVIVHAHGITWSNTVFVRLSERNIPAVICGSNHAPVACLWPLAGHHAQGARMRAQVEAPQPLKKQLWQKIVASKIRMQGHILSTNGKEGAGFDMLARQVRSGDPDNREAQAARRYWKALFGAEFTRDADLAGINSLLNYGYTVLRAMVSRSICAAGLHPTLGVFHSNRGNSFALSDDLMEPYRPLVDQLVFNLVNRNEGLELTPAFKQAITAISIFDLETSIGISPLSVQIQRMLHSLATSFETGKADLDLPLMPSPLRLKTLGIAHE